MGREERETFEDTRQDPSGRERTVSGNSIRYGQTMEPQEEFVGDGIRSEPRETRQVFDDHQARVRQGDLDADFSENYAEDAVLVTGTGVHRGRREIQETLLAMERRLAGAAVESRSCFVEGDLVFAEWEALTPRNERISAAETYVVRGGRIVAQTLHYEAE